MADIDINRPAYDLPAFDEIFHRNDKAELPVLQRMKLCTKTYCACSGDCVKRKLFGLFPFINIMRNYQWKKWLLPDIISGLCVGVIHIPQSMGFSILTSLPPVYGLYSTLFPVVLYFFFGTSRHISVGTMAVISIMIGAVVEREADLFIASKPGLTTTVSASVTAQVQTDNTTLPTVSDDDDTELIEFKLGIAVSVSCIVGIMQIVMSLLRLGVVATFMSTPFIGGFMTGAAVHIVTSQVPFCLGISIPKQVGIFRVPKLWYWIFKTIPETVPGEIITCLTCMTVLVLLKEVINEKYRDKLKVPIPAELLVVVVATVISHFAKLHDRFDIRILKNIPKGIPPPMVPSFYNATTYIVDSFVIAIVSFSISISLAKLFSQKHRYPIDQNQELLAYGIMHTVGAFLSSFAGAQAPPRTLVHEQTGGKTQLASLVSALLILLVCLVLAPLFEPLPNSVLGTIIIVALFPLFKNFKGLPHFWRVSKYDFFVWVISFLSVVILNIDVGIAIGVGVSVLCLILETHLASGKVLAKARKTELYMSVKKYKDLEDLSTAGLYVFKFESPLYFANVETFKNQLFAKTQNPETFLKDKENNVQVVDRNMNHEIDHEEKKDGSLPSGLSKDNTDITMIRENHLDGAQISTISIEKPNHVSGTDRHDSTHHSAVVIVDCSAITYIDVMGLNMMKYLKTTYKDAGMQLALVNCTETLLQKMQLHGIDVTEGVYPSIQDAVAITLRKIYKPECEITCF